MSGIKGGLEKETFDIILFLRRCRGGDALTGYGVSISRFGIPYHSGGVSLLRWEAIDVRWKAVERDANDLERWGKALSAIKNPRGRVRDRPRRD